MAEELIGKVTHYFDRLGVAVIKLDKGVLAAGDSLKFRHADKEFDQVVDSLEVDRKAVAKIKAGEEAGLKVNEPVKEGWLVYRLT